VPQELARRDARSASRTADRIDALGAPRVARGDGLGARARLTSTDDDASTEAPAPERQDGVLRGTLALTFALPDPGAVGVDAHVGAVEGARTP
jgi:hypothetical protein